MTRHLRLGEFLLGVVGIALMRHLLEDDSTAAARIRMVLSDLHPAAVTLGGGAYFQDGGGRAGVVRGYGHLHGDYLRAFEKVGLRVRSCLEPRYGPAEAAMQGPASSFIPAAAAAFIGVPGALIWELDQD